MPRDYELKGKAFIDEQGKKHGFVPGICWYTNLDLPKRHDLLDLRGNLSDIISSASGELEIFVPELLRSDDVKFSDEIYQDEELNNNPAPKIQRDHEFVRVKIHASPFEHDSQKFTLLTFEDITESKRNREQLHRVLSMENSLGILNRYGSEHFILREMKLALKNKSHLSILILNLDNFRLINETRGYAYGNRILRNFARVLKEVFISAGNVIGRWSGDEFVVLSRKSGTEARLLANELHRNASDLESDLTLSIGIAEFREENGTSLHDLIARAYDAMIAAKKSGGGRTILAQETRLGKFAI